MHNALKKQSVMNIVVFQVFLAFLFHWLEHKVPRWALTISVVGFGYLGSRSITLLDRVDEYFIPSVYAIFIRSPDWPLLINCWSHVLLYVAACSVHKRVAFLAAVKLYNRYKFVVAP